MNRRRADLVVGLLVAAVLVLGGFLSWQAYGRSRTLDGAMGSMMGGSPGLVHGPNPLWYVLGTLVASAVVAGLYLVVREEVTTRGTVGADYSETNGGAAHAESDDATTAESGPPGSFAGQAQPTRRVLDLLPDDERRVLEPVITSPGITQIELRDRSDFSKSKVSQTVSELEKRGLLYRERQGRTYRVYPSDELRSSDG